MNLVRPQVSRHACPPTVLVDRARNHANFDTVCSDNLDTAYRGTRHLLELGHTDVTLLISSVRPYASSQTELKDIGAPWARPDSRHIRKRISFGGSTIEGCRAAIEQDLRRSNPPTAIFAATFYATLGAVKAINALDLAFPEEISLLGFESLGMDDGNPPLYQRSQTIGG